MTISLLIDTATSRTSVAIMDGAKTLWSGHNDGATDHGPAVGALVAQALDVAPTIDEVRVGMGPGPFTGLRVGIAFAQSFALARNIPVIGFCSLDAIFCDQSEYIAATDARRKEIYWARYKDGVRIDGPHVCLPAELNADVPVIGEGAIKYKLSENDGYPDLAKALALTDVVSQPMYLRRPDAVPTSERA